MDRGFRRFASSTTKLPNLSFWPLLIGLAAVVVRIVVAVIRTALRNISSRRSAHKLNLGRAQVAESGSWRSPTGTCGDRHHLIITPPASQPSRPKI
jgi:hypothetical protein